MTFRIFSFVLLAALFLQSAAAFGPATVAQRAGEIEHLIVHYQDANHHHHSDSSLHMDDDVAVQHSHPDYGSSAALVNAPHPTLIVSGFSSLAEAQTAFWISATVDALLRPPTLRV
jgi:hypothetical protein